jgi:hypothetical protein
MTLPTLGFHHWLCIDSGEDGAKPEDQCFQCGVITPEFGVGVVSDHGPLPIGCPGPNLGPWPAHYFYDVGEGTIECVQCDTQIGPDTLPADVEWRCNPSGDWECYLHPGSTPEHCDSYGTVIWSCGCTI